MKRVLSILIAISLCIIGTAIADNEEFQLRNGIVFGDTLDVVKEKETGTIQDGSVDKTNAVWFTTPIAGMDGSVRYDFDEETGKLTDMLYSFESTTDKDAVDNDYSKLKSSLVRKYGSPLGNTGGSLHLITGLAIEYSASIIGLYRYLLEGGGDFRDYDEWIVDCNGYNVKIDLTSYYVRTKDYDYTYYNNISYHYYTDEDYLNALQEKQDENAAIDNDL